MFVGLYIASALVRVVSQLRTKITGNFSFIGRAALTRANVYVGLAHNR